MSYVRIIVLWEANGSATYRWIDTLILLGSKAALELVRSKRKSADIW